MAKLKIILTTPFVLIWFGFLAVSPILPFLIPHLPRPWDWALGTALVATLVGVVAKSRIDASASKTTPSSGEGGNADQT